MIHTKLYFGLKFFNALTVLYVYEGVERLFSISQIFNLGKFFVATLSNLTRFSNDSICGGFKGWSGCNSLGA